MPRKRTKVSATKEIEKKTGKPHRWKKGESGNPAGRPKNSDAEELRIALDAAKHLEGDQSLLESVCRRAYRSDALAIAILRKLLPDKTKSEVDENKTINIEIVNFAEIEDEEECQ